MKKAVKTHFRTVLAIIGLVSIAMATSYVILQNQRVRIPILEARPFELKAEFETAQAVTPGQGQNIRVAGVKIGDVQDVELDDGVAVVTFAIDPDYVPVYRDATILMRPQTGLKDMFFELDPGNADAGRYEPGETITVANTQPDINLDEVLAVLDQDSRSYLRLVALGLGQGLDGRGADLGRAVGKLGPINADLAKLNRTLAQRDEELARVVHNLNVLTGAIGERDEDLVELVDTSSSALGAIAEQAPDLQRLTRDLPGTLSEARRALDETTPFARELGPALRNLRPFASRIDEVAAATEKLGVAGTPAVRDRLRPLIRAANPVIPQLRVAAGHYADAAEPLRVVGRKVNRLANRVAYNPRGAEAPGTAGRDEGYLYWLGWFAHNGTSIFSVQDAHGQGRRLFLTASCANLAGLLQNQPGGSVLVGALITGLGPLFAPGGECYV